MTSYPDSIHQNSINYECILLNLKKQSEQAYQTFVETKNLLDYATKLSEIILHALDNGLEYPRFNIYEFLKECRTLETNTK